MRLRSAAALLWISLPSVAPAKSTVPVQRSTIIDSVGFVRGTIGGKGPYWFLIDTGASRSAFDSEVAKALNLPVTGASSVEGTGGTVTVKQTRIPQLRIGAVTVRALEPTVYDLAGSLAPPGSHIAGILGVDALRRSAILWDRALGRVTIAPAVSALASLRGASSVPFQLDNGIPRIEAEIDGVPVLLRLDTGASIADGPATFVNVTQAFYDRLHAAEPDLRPYTSFTASGTGGAIEIPVVKAHRLKIGEAVVNEPRLIVQKPVGYFGRADAVGFLGGYAFNQWRGFVVDYPGRRLILLPK